MRAERLRHRATYIVVHDGMGKILVQRRTDTKDFLPVCWMPLQAALFRQMKCCWIRASRSRRRVRYCGRAVCRARSVLF
jgi:hypothetical protein